MEIRWNNASVAIHLFRLKFPQSERASEFPFYHNLALASFTELGDSPGGWLAHFNPGPRPRRIYVYFRRSVNRVTFSHASSIGAASCCCYKLSLKKKKTNKSNKIFKFKFQIEAIKKERKKSKKINMSSEVFL